HRQAVDWIEQLRGRVPVEYRPTDSEGAVRQHQGLCLRDGIGAARLVEQLASDGSTVMVLGSCGYMLTPVIAALREAAIPFHNPYRVAQGAWNPLAAAARLLAFLRPHQDAWGEEARLWTWEELRQWTGPIMAKGTMVRGGKTFIEGKARTGGRFESEEDRVVRDLHLVLEQFETQHWDSIWAGDIPWWLERLKHNDRKRQRYVCELALRRGAAVLRERPKVIVGTIHSVKG